MKVSDNTTSVDDGGDRRFCLGSSQVDTSVRGAMVALVATSSVKAAYFCVSGCSRAHNANTTWFADERHQTTRGLTKTKNEKR